MDVFEIVNKIVDLEIQRRVIEFGDVFFDFNLRYWRYVIGEIEEVINLFDKVNKIGEGGYGFVYKGYFDYIFVVIKVLRLDVV